MRYPQRGVLRWLCANFLFLLSGAALADCFHDAASFHRVNPLILRAIAIVESGGRPDATNRNRNGSVDYGMMQINSIHLPELARYGIGVSDLYDGCKSVFTGALILRRSIDKYGNTWAAVGSYNSATPYFRDRYAAKVKTVVEFLLTQGYADEAQ
ncbi:lytic transglycosylase [Cupriavidus sp. UYMU48A]|nr:lytic transglycosylase [Cupriavidus sp. UYMU48A]